MIKIAHIDQQIATLKEGIGEYTDQIKVLQGYVQALQKEMASLVAERGEIRVKSMEASKPDWCLLFAPKINLSTREEVFFNRHLRDMGLELGGKWSDTDQSALYIRMPKDDESTIHRTERGIELVLPYLVPNEKGVVQFGIREHSLSENGIYRLEYDTKSYRPSLTRTTWGRRLVKRDFDNVRAALTYIARNHYDI